MAHILIIDDDEQLRGFLEILLTRDGHTVKMAASGSEGIAVYHEEKFDLVITDIIMPNGRGIDVILSLQQSNDKTPIIAISGGNRQMSDAQFNLAAVASMGVKETLEKPFTVEELRRAITRAFLN